MWVLRVVVAGLTVAAAEECHAISSAATDLWCNQNCNHDPPFCPATLCQCGSAPPRPSPSPSPSPSLSPGPLHQGGILGGYFANWAQYHKSPDTYGASNVAGIAGETDHIYFSFVTCFAQVDLIVLNCKEPSAVAMYCGDGAAARRRHGRFRQFLKHEQLSVKMHVAAALHHSAQRGARVDPRLRLVPTPAPRPAPRPLPLFLFSNTWRPHL